MIISITLPPHFWDDLDPDGIIERGAAAAAIYQIETVGAYLRHRAWRGQPAWLRRLAGPMRLRLDAERAILRKFAN